MKLYKIIATLPDRTTGTGRNMVTHVGGTITCRTGLTYSAALDIKSKLLSRKFTVLKQHCPDLDRDQIERIISNEATFAAVEQFVPAQ